MFRITEVVLHKRNQLAKQLKLIKLQHLLDSKRTANNDTVESRRHDGFW